MPKTLLHFFIALAGLLFVGSASAQTCAAPGREGPATPSGTINSYHAGSNAATAANATSIAVASIAGQRANTRSLAAGDLILIMQMQDSASPTTAGRHEYAQITGISGTTLLLNRQLTNVYNRSTAVGNIRTWQVVYVPQYSSAAISGTVSAEPWSISPTSGDGTGGIVAMDVAGSLSLTGTIDASGAGFRGGAGLNGGGNRAAGAAYTDANYTFSTTPATLNGAIKGEGIEGTPINVFEGAATPIDYTTLLGQGYAAGSAGRGARSNAGGSGNDGDPTGSTYGGNSLNSGGGGGGNAGAGGQGGNAWNQNTTGGAFNLPAAGNTGNAAGGQGGIAQTASATRLIMGGGGGAGTANNGSASSVTTWPPTNSSTAANGAAGAITSSGSAGGGIVLLRAGSFSATAGVVNASGYRAYNKAPAGDTDSAGGGGAGGSVSIRVAAPGASGAGLTINATGGAGGSSSYYNHGPGGGGGGGYVSTSFTGATINVGGGPNGTDGCCGGTNGNGSPKAYNSAAGSTGTFVASDTSVTPGVTSGASCLPVVVASKSTTTPTITSSTGATVTYRINLSNTGGAATNLFVFDAGLPPGWGYASTPAPTYTFSPAPPATAGNNPAGAEATAATLPGGLPVGNASTVNAGAGISLTTTPGLAPSNGANTLTFGSFYLPQNSSLTITFAATIPDQATAGTYHNPAGVVFLDPTRTAATRMVSPLADLSSNRTGTPYGSNTAYQSGPGGNVGGSNYNGLVAGPTTEDVTLLPDLSVTKTSNTPTFTVGASALQYIVVARNNGRPVANQIFLNTQATGVSATAVASAALTITDTLPTAMTVTALANSNPANWACAANATSTTFACTAGAGIYPLNAATDIVTVTATVAVSAGACPGPQVNTVTFTTATLGETSTTNNTGTSSVAIGCGTNLTASKTNNTNAVTAGGTTSYTVTFANLGPAAANGAVVSDAAGTGLACTVASCGAAGGASCPAAGLYPNLLASNVALPLLPASSSVSFVVNCSVTATGQ